MNTPTNIGTFPGSIAVPASNMNWSICLDIWIRYAAALQTCPKHCGIATMLAYAIFAAITIPILSSGDSRTFTAVAKAAICALLILLVL